MAVGFENLKNAIGQGADVVITQMQERATKLYKEFGGDKAIVVFDKMKAEYIDAKNWLDGKADETATKITNELNQLVQDAKIKADVSTSNATASANAEVGINGSKSIDYPELANKKLMEFDAGLSAVQATGFSEFRIKDKLDQSKLSAEQIKNLDAFDKVQASLYIMLRNASKRDLPAGFLMRASVVMTKDLFDHIGNGKSSGGFDLSKTTEGINELTSNKTIGAGVGEFKKSIDSFGQSIKESGITDMLNTVQTGLSMFNDIPEVSKKWNNFFAWIGDGDLSGIDLTKSSIPAIYTVYQGCKSGYPSTEQTQGLNVVGNDADWIGKNSGKMLSTDATMLGYLDKNTKQIIDSIINKENQDTLKKIVNQGESIVDTLLSAAGDSEYAINTIESILKRLSGIFGGDAMRTLGSMLGVDMSTLLDTLDAKLSPKQEQQLTAFLKSYQPSTVMGPHEWEQYISDDPESKKQGIVHLINVGDIKKGLVVMTPAASVVRQFVGDDETKKVIYFDKDETGALTILKDWSKVSDADKTALVDGYMNNENIIKNLIKDVTGADGDDMKLVGKAATGYMKGARGDKFYENYDKEHTNDKKKTGENASTKNEIERQYSDAILADNNKVKAKDTWKQYSSEALFKLPTDIKYDFAVARLLGNYPTSSMTVAEELIMKIASGITISPLSTKEIAANMWLGFGGIAYGETGLNMTIANKEIQDLSQKAKGLFGRSVDKDPDGAIAKDIMRLKSHTWGFNLTSRIDTVLLGTPEYYVLSYIGYLIDRTNIVKGASGMYGNPSFEPFSVLANINNYCDGKLGGVDELDKQIKYYFQGAHHELGKTGEKACQFVRSSLGSQITK